MNTDIIDKNPSVLEFLEPSLTVKGGIKLIKFLQTSNNTGSAYNLLKGILVYAFVIEAKSHCLFYNVRRLSESAINFHNNLFRPKNLSSLQRHLISEWKHLEIRLRLQAKSK